MFGIYGSASNAQGVQASGETIIGRWVFEDGGTAIVWSGASGEHIVVACYEEGDGASVEVQHRCADEDDISTECKDDGDSHKIYKGGCTAVTPLRGRIQIVPGTDGGTSATGSFAVMRGG